jgi:HTH-type transcriptional regulator / antitoxin HigA
MTIDSKAFRTPGQFIQALLDERGWSQRTLAIVLGIGVTTINKIVGNKQPVDGECAVILEEVFKIPAEHFLALQKDMDLAQARIVVNPDPGRATRALLYGDLPVAEMIRRGWITAESIRDTKKVENELMRFFGVNRLDDIEILPHAAKKTETNTPPTPAQLAWLYRVKQIASEMLTVPYSPQAVKAAIGKLRASMFAVEDVAKVPRIMIECGIRFVIVESGCRCGMTASIIFGSFYVTKSNTFCNCTAEREQCLMQSWKATAPELARGLRWKSASRMRPRKSFAYRRHRWMPS